MTQQHDTAPQINIFFKNIKDIYIKNIKNSSMMLGGVRKDGRLEAFKKRPVDLGI